MSPVLGTLFQLLILALDKEQFPFWDESEILSEINIQVHHSMFGQKEGKRKRMDYHPNNFFRPHE